MTVYIANLLPPNIYFEDRILVTKLLFAVFIAGFISAVISYFLLKMVIKKTKLWIKQRNRLKRLKTKKIAGALFIGEITQYFGNINVAVIEVKAKKLSVGDKVLIKGIVTNVQFEVGSMQIDKKDVTVVKKGVEVGIKVPEVVKNGDLVYKLK